MILNTVRTEKAIKNIEKHNTITFIVENKDTEEQITKEVEKKYGVKVDSVNTLTTAIGQKRALVKLKKEFKAEDLASKLKMVA